MISSQQPYNENVFIVKDSNIKKAGKGLFTTISIPVNRRVIYYRGVVMEENDGHVNKKISESQRDNHSYCWVLKGSKGNICINSTHTPEYKARYVNDSYGSKFKNNLRVIMDHKNKRVTYVSTRNIRAGEELFISYGDGYWGSRK